MKSKKGLCVSILVVCFLVGLSLPLFMSNHKKVKADTITDLTNTTWTFNNSISSFMGNTRYYINFYLENSTSSTYTGILCPNTGTILFYNGNNIINAFQTGSWNNNNYKTIVITGGTDSTNSTLISWFETNATQQIPIPPGSQITSRYWSPDGVITMQDNQRIGDDDIQYTILFNEFTDTYTDTTQTGLYFLGLQTNQEPQWSYIESINGDGINLLYHGTTNNINNAMWLEFTIGDYMDTDLFNLMSLYGTWFDDSSAYLVGMNQGYVEGKVIGRALGQVDGVEYTNIITRIFNGLGDILTIQVFPNITIALIIGLPLLLGVFIIIIKILRG